MTIRMLRIDRDTTAWKIQAELQHLKRALLEEVNSVGHENYMSFYT